MLGRFGLSLRTARRALAVEFAWATAFSQGALLLTRLGVYLGTLREGNPAALVNFLPGWAAAVVLALYMVGLWGALRYMAKRGARTAWVCVMVGFAVAAAVGADFYHDLSASGGD